MRDVPVWQELLENHYNSNSYTNKLKAENKRLKAKLSKIEQIVNSRDGFYLYDNLPPFQQIKEILDKE